MGVSLQLLAQDGKYRAAVAAIAEHLVQARGAKRRRIFARSSVEIARPDGSGSRRQENYFKHPRDRRQRLRRGPTYPASSDFRDLTLFEQLTTPFGQLTREDCNAKERRRAKDHNVSAEDGSRGPPRFFNDDTGSTLGRAKSRGTHRRRGRPAEHRCPFRARNREARRHRSERPP